MTTARVASRYSGSTLRELRNANPFGELLAVRQTTIPLDEPRTGLHVLELLYGDRSVVCEPDRVEPARGRLKRREDMAVIDAKPA